MAAHPTLSVSSPSALIDEPVQARVSGCRPGERVTVSARVDDAHRGRWRSRAVFEADAAGAVDLALARPLDGGYVTPDPFGLLWSLDLDPAEPPRSGFSALAEPFMVTLAVEMNGAPVDRVEVCRRFMAPSVTRVPVREDGLVATFFAPGEGRPRPGILVVGGSDGGLSEGMAALLASHGFATLALAYFRAEHLPKELIEIPLEYFETAIRWLGRRASVRAGRLGVVGRSRGGELALLLAATFPDLRAVVGYVPSGLVHAGIAASLVPGEAPRSAWTHRGRPLPFLPQAPAAREDATPPAPSAPIELTPMFLRSLEDRAAVEAAGIPVERIPGPVLLISGEADRLWPSPALADFAVARLTAHRRPVTHLRYAGAGHMIGPLGLPATVDTIVHPLRGLRLALGGTPAAYAAAAAHSWPRVIEFLRAGLDTSP